MCSSLDNNERELIALDLIHPTQHRKAVRKKDDSFLESRTFLPYLMMNCFVLQARAIVALTYQTTHLSNRNNSDDSLGKVPFRPIQTYSNQHTFD